MFRQVREYRDYGGELDSSGHEDPVERDSFQPHTGSNESECREKGNLCPLKIPLS